MINSVSHDAPKPLIEIKTLRPTVKRRATDTLGYDRSGTSNVRSDQ
jgi:hypothetical protein